MQVVRSVFIRAIKLIIRLSMGHPRGGATTWYCGGGTGEGAIEDKVKTLNLTANMTRCELKQHGARVPGLNSEGQ